MDETFTGQTDDPGTGLIDYNARHDDPALGRFTQADTILDGLNRYTYVRNNPLNKTDPTGHCVQDLQVHNGYVVYTPMRGAECFGGDASANALTEGNGRWKADAEDPYYESARTPRRTFVKPGVRQGPLARLENIARGIEQSVGAVTAACTSAFWTGVGAACVTVGEPAQVAAATFATGVTCLRDIGEQCGRNIGYTGHTAVTFEAAKYAAKAAAAGGTIRDPADPREWTEATNGEFADMAKYQAGVNAVFSVASYLSGSFWNAGPIKPAPIQMPAVAPEHRGIGYR